LITPTNAPLVYTNTVIYRSYMLRCHLRHPPKTLHEDWKLTKIQNYTSNSYYVKVFLQKT